MTTFDGLYYNFMAAGEFTLAQSGVVGNAFDVQIRMQPWFVGASVSVTTMVGVQVGTHRITFAIDRNNVVWEDGNPISPPVDGAPIDLGAGSLAQLTPTSFEIRYNGGTVVTVNDYGSYLNTEVTIPDSLPPGSVKGLLGSDSGNQSKEFTLPNGTVLAQPLSYSDLYTTWSNAWRVAQGSSLMDYGTGQTTGTFTDLNFPNDSASITTLPSNVAAAAEALVAAAGITNPAIAQGAVEDYLATGDPSFITSAAAAQAAGGGTTAVLAEPTNPNATGGVGLSEPTPSIPLSASGTTDVTFEVYRTGSTAAAQVVDYQVLSPGTGYVGTGNFAGGTLPSGQVTLDTGVSSENFTVAVTGSIGTAPQAMLLAEIDTGTSGTPVLAPTGEVTLTSPTPVEGTPAAPMLLDPAGVGTLTSTGNAYTLDLTSITKGASVAPFVIDLANEAGAGGNTLAGSLTVSGSGVAVQGAAGLASVAAGALGPLTLDVGSTTVGPFANTLDIAATQSNASGFNGSLGAVSLVVEGDVVLPCFAAGTRIATEDGERAIERLRVGDLVRTAGGGLRRIVWIGARAVDCARHPRPQTVRPIRVRAGAFGPGLPSRDLRLSPDHAVFAPETGGLVPVKCLVDGAAVRQERVAKVRYLHLELEAHALVLAEGLAVESFLDTGNRVAFANGGPVVQAFPDFAARMWEAMGCAPLQVVGPAVEELRAMLRVAPKPKRRTRRCA
jgi:hypothetical protein